MVGDGEISSSATHHIMRTAVFFPYLVFRNCNISNITTCGMYLAQLLVVVKMSIWMAGSS